MEKSYLSPSDVAELLMVSTAAVRQWAQKGDLPARTTPGGHRRFLRQDVEQFAKRRGLSLNVGNDDTLRVLIVDDNEQIRQFLTTLLAKAAPSVMTDVAENGFEAGLKVKSFQPNAVLLDIMMPELNGFQVCELLKQDPSTKHIRIIAMTGYPSPENVQRILAAGAEECLTKPLDVPKLMAALGIEAEGIGAELPA
jgi:excisionase family DNA binding protein